MAEQPVPDAPDGYQIHIGNLTGMGIAIGRGASATVNLMQYPALRDYWYGNPFAALINKETAAFVGREWVFAWLEEQRAARPGGYLRIVAAAGLGKTALAEAIAARYNAQAFFVSASEGRTRPAQALAHLCADLIIRFQLDQDTPEVVRQF